VEEIISSIGFITEFLSVAVKSPAKTVVDKRIKQTI
jgi:hypothetical protein